MTEISAIMRAGDFVCPECYQPGYAVLHTEITEDLKNKESRECIDGHLYFAIVDMEY